MRRLVLLCLAAVAGCESQQPPAPCGPIAQVTVNAGERASVTACFNDPNGDLLTYSVTSSNPGVATASISGTDITVAAVVPGSATVTVTASDPGGLQAGQSFVVVVPNRAPEPRGAMPSVTVPAGGAETVDASSYFTEPDGETLAYSATSSDQAAVAVAVAGSVVTVTAVARGTANVTVTATDPGGLAATQTFLVTVPNRAPVAGDPIPDVEVSVGEAVAVNASAHFADPDGDELVFAVAVSVDGVVRATVSGGVVSLEAVAQGMATVTVTATDPEGLSAESSFAATVPNRAPVAGDPIPDVEVAVGSAAEVDASKHFADPDGDELTYSVATSDPGVAAVAVSGSVVSVEAVALGMATVTIMATDPEGLSAESSFAATVPNRAPVAGDPIPDVEVSVGGEVEVDASKHFADPDGDELSFAVSTSDAGVAAVSVAGSVVSVAVVALGTATVTVTATDPGGLSARSSFTVTVRNRAPVAGDPIPDVEVSVGGEVEVDASKHFADPDGDELSFAVSTSDAGVARVSVAGSSVSVQAVALGTAAVTVTATDPDGLSAESSFAVTVSGQAVTAEITSCKVIFIIPIVLRTVVIKGVAYASRSVVDVQVQGFVDGDRAGVAQLGRMAAGQEKDFTIQGTTWLPLGDHSCAVRVKWRERDDPPGMPEVTLATNAGNAPEGTSVTMRVLVSPSPSEAISVGYTRSPDADPSTADADAADFADGSRGTIEVPAGASEATIRVLVNDDTDIEPAQEFFRASLDTPGQSAGYQLGWVTSALAYIEEGVCDRTPQVRDEIMDRADVADCNKVTDWDVGNVDWLDLTPSSENRPIVTLRQGDFSGLNHLRSLNLDDNRLTQLPSGIFSGLLRLRWLDLADNALARLPDGVFTDLAGLESLDLGGNRMAELPADLFSDLSTLEELDVGGNRLRELPADVFTDLSGLDRLHLHENQIAELPAGLFDNLTALERLDLQENRIGRLPSGTFANLSALARLDLDANRITALPAGVFSGLSGLTWLEVSDNAVSRLEGDVFADTPVLERLLLWRNRIAQLPPRVFAGLHGGLSGLGVSGNPGYPFVLTLKVERRDSDNPSDPGPATVGVTVAQGAPFTMRIPLSVEGGTLSQDYVILEAGYTRSSEVTVTQSSGSSATTVGVESLPEVPPWVDIGLVAGARLVLFGS